MSHKKFGPDRFSRFDVYWIQTDKQTNRQTDKPNLYIDKSIILHYLAETDILEERKIRLIKFDNTLYNVLKDGVFMKF